MRRTEILVRGAEWSDGRSSERVVCRGCSRSTLIRVEVVSADEAGYSCSEYVIIQREIPVTVSRESDPYDSLEGIDARSAYFLLDAVVIVVSLASVALNKKSATVYTCSIVVCRLRRTLCVE